MRTQLKWLVFLILMACVVFILAQGQPERKTPSLARTNLSVEIRTDTSPSQNQQSSPSSPQVKESDLPASTPEKVPEDSDAEKGEQSADPIISNDREGSFFQVQKGFSLPGPASFIKPDKARSLAQNQVPDELDSEIDVLSPFSGAEYRIPDPDSYRLVDYEKYGEFLEEGTPRYRFVLRDRENFRSAVGAGIYPAESSLRHFEPFRPYYQKGYPPGEHWNVLTSDNIPKAIAVWTTAKEDRGVRMFYLGRLYERAGMLVPAVKAYYACLVHFPRSVSWSADGSFAWSVAEAAIQSLRGILEKHPEIPVVYKGGTVRMDSSDGLDMTQAGIVVSPGRLEFRVQSGEKNF